MILVVNAVKKFFADKKGRVVLFQIPNIPIIAWFLFLLLSKVLSGDLRLWAGLISTFSLLIWALLELGWGVSYFRRALGLVVVLYIALSKL